jgi:leucyl-tRNA---protein transferase
MSLPNEQPLQKLQFYVTTPYKCGYLPNKMAQSLIASPQHLIDTSIYNGLIQQGFRRSGKFAYRPHCENCRSCVSVRLLLNQFTPNRSQKRSFKQHLNLQVRILPLHFNQTHFALYNQYQNLRHADVENIKQREPKSDEEEYRQFLCQSNIESLMIEFSDAQNQVKIVSVIDMVENGISAVYTFYDARETKASVGDAAKRASYGTYNIMWLADWAKSLGLDYLYLGYWIQDSQKMAYKQQFNPQEKLIDGEWV